MAYLCVGSAYPGDKRSFRRQYFEWPEQRHEAKAYVIRENKAGKRVWKSTALLASKRGTDENALPCNKLSFEVDRELTPDAWSLLNKLGATIIASGTPGHVHIEIRVDEHLPWHENARWAEAVARACGVTGHPDSGGKWGPAALLAIVGTRNTKPGLGSPLVVVHTRGAGTTMQALRSLVTPLTSAIAQHARDDAIAPVETCWRALTADVRSTYRSGHTVGPRFIEVGRLVAMGMRRGMSDGQILWLLTTGPDGEGYEPAVDKAADEGQDLQRYATREIRKMRRKYEASA